MKKYLLLFATFLISKALTAQFYYPTKTEASAVKSKKLAIELLKESDSTNIILNNALKDIFDNNWKNNSSVAYFSPSEIQKLIASKNNEYAYLVQNKAATEDRRTRSRYISSSGLSSTYPTSGNSTEVRTGYVAFRFHYYPFSLKIFNGNQLNLVTRISFGNPDLTKADYLFLSQQLDRLLNYAYNGKSTSVYYGSIEDNAKKVKESELQILDEFFKEKDLKKMASHYKDDFKIVTIQKQEQTVLNKEQGKIYLKIIWNDFQKVYMWVTIDAETGRVLSQMSFGGINFGTNHYANELIKAKHLKYASNKLFQKVNSRSYR